MADLQAEVVLTSASQMDNLDTQIGFKFLIKPATDITIGAGKVATYQINFTIVGGDAPGAKVMARSITGAAGTGTVISATTGYLVDEYYYPGQVVTDATIDTIATNLSAKIYNPA